MFVLFYKFSFTPFRTNPTKWSNTLKQFIGNSQWIVWVCLTIVWGWRLKGWSSLAYSFWSILKNHFEHENFFLSVNNQLRSAVSHSIPYFDFTTPLHPWHSSTDSVFLVSWDLFKKYFAIAYLLYDWIDYFW